jgi:hypothetical protein
VYRSKSIVTINFPLGEQDIYAILSRRDGILLLSIILLAGRKPFFVLSIIKYHAFWQQ